jgi:serine/threonine protein kinase
LERVKTLKDPNIVKIITAYKHGDRFNIIFPCARTNLGQYIRDQHYGAGDSYAGTVEMHPFWREMLGVARALNRIINNVSDATGKNSMYGYHFDLKPANVLIEDVPEGAKFLISDFGQATFKNVDGDSKISGVGGTEAYAPPEVDQGHIKRNRKYDIWSLGCILLEVCAFVVEGYAGVKQFDEVRQSVSPSTGCRDDYYWHRLPGPRYELKPQIVLWMDSLSNSNSVRNQRTCHFIKDIMALLRKMLEVNMELRMASETVYAKLSLLLDQYQSPPTSFSRRLSDDSDDSDELVIGEDLVELGRDRLAQIHQIHCLSAGRWYGGAAKLVEDWSNVLTLLTFLQEANPPLELGSRTELRLLPYSETSLSVGNLSSSGTNALLILRAPQGSPQMPEITKIFFSNTKDAIAMQSVFLGQDIKPLGQRPDRSLSLYSAAIEKRSAKLRSILPRPKLASAIETLGPASFVQLWSEQSYRDPLKALSRPKRDSPRAKEEFLLCAAPRRIVIFFQTALLIVPIARNARVEKSKDTASKALKIVPTDKKADPSFVACLLHPTSKLQGRYALPLHRGQLEKEEYKGSFECKALEIVFQSEGDLIVFSKAYLALKKEWKDEDDQIKRSRRQMGPELGWAAD